jgi:hypothetical protein
MSFEFNQHYLKFLAYHHVSNRFRSFMMDNESRRVDAGWMLEESKMATRSEPSIGETDSIHAASATSGSVSIWDYIDEHRKHSPTFYNFFFTTREQEPVSLFGLFHLFNLRFIDTLIRDITAQVNSSKLRLSRVALPPVTLRYYGQMVCYSYHVFGLRHVPRL